MDLKRRNKKRVLRPDVIVAPPHKDVYMYHDYRAFLNDEIKRQTKSYAGFSMRSIARTAGLAPGHLSMVLSGKKNLSSEKLLDLARALSLKPAEQNHLNFLLSLCDAHLQEDRIDALHRLQRSIGYQTKNPNEHHVYRYLSRWFYVVIREMATKSGFQADAKWIQSKLQFQVPLMEIKEALEFLISNDYIKILPDGSAKASSESLNCMGGVYQIVLAQFHKEMFEVATKSLDTLTGKERYLEGYTCSLSQAHFKQAQKIISQAIDEIEALEKLAHSPNATEGSPADSEENIYHFCFFGIPMLKTPKEGKE